MSVSRRTMMAINGGPFSLNARLRLRTIWVVAALAALLSPQVAAARAAPLSMRLDLIDNPRKPGRPTLKITLRNTSSRAVWVYPLIGDAAVLRLEATHGRARELKLIRPGLPTVRREIALRAFKQILPGQTLTQMAPWPSDYQDIAEGWSFIRLRAVYDSSLALISAYSRQGDAPPKGAAAIQVASDWITIRLRDGRLETKPAAARRATQSIVSPALWSQDRLAMTMPIAAGVEIRAQNPAINWASSSFNAHLDVNTESGMAVRLRFEVLQYAWGRAERKGMLAGQRFRTMQGRLATLTMKRFGWERKAYTNWYFAFIAPKSQDVTILRFECESRAADRLYPLICRMVQGVAFRPVSTGSRAKAAASKA